MPAFLCSVPPYNLDAGDSLMPVIGLHSLLREAAGLTTDQTAAAGFPITNVADPRTHLRWRSGTDGDAITINTNYPADINYLAIAAHNLGTSNIPFTVLARGFGDSPAGFLSLFGPLTVDDDSPILFRWSPATWDQIRIEFSLVTGRSPEIGVINLGALFEFERSIKVATHHIPFNFWAQSTLVCPKPEMGTFPGRLLLSRKSNSVLNFQHIDQSWFRTELQPNIERMQETPFFVAWDAGEYPEDVGYAWLSDDPVPKIDPVTRLVEVDLNMEGFFE